MDTNPRDCHCAATDRDWIPWRDGWAWPIDFLTFRRLSTDDTDMHRYFNCNLCPSVSSVDEKIISWRITLTSSVFRYRRGLRAMDNRGWADQGRRFPAAGASRE